MANGRNRSGGHPPILGAGGGSPPPSHNPNPRPGNGGGQPDNDDPKGTAIGIAAGVVVLLLLVSICAGIFVGPMAALAVVGIILLVVVAIVVAIGGIAVGTMKGGDEAVKKNGAAAKKGESEFPSDMPFINPLPAFPWPLWIHLGPEQAVLSRAFMKSGIDYNDDGEVVDVRGFALHTGAFFVPWKLLLTGHYPVAILDSSKPEPFTWTVAVNTAVDKLKVTLQMGAWWDRSNDNGGNSVIVKAVRLATAREGTWQGILRSLAERKLNERVAGHQATEVEDSKRDINADVTSRANCDAAEMGLMTEISILVVESGVKTESHEAEQKAGAESRGKMAGYKELLDSPAVAALAEGLGRALGNLGGGKNGGNGGNNP